MTNKLYIPLHLLKKYSDDNHGILEKSIDVDLFIHDHDLLGLFVNRTDVLNKHIRLNFNLNGHVLEQDITMEQYHDILELNVLLSQVDPKDLDEPLFGNH